MALLPGCLISLSKIKTKRMLSLTRLRPCQNGMHKSLKGQLEVNKVEAASKSMFVAGWRPAVGWTCCIALLSNYILIPMANFGLLLAEMGVEVPSLDMSAMMPVLLGYAWT